MNWISVEDEKPKKTCLIVAEYPSGYRQTVHAYNHLGRWRMSYTEDEVFEDVEEKVTHWMPLPEPPKN